MPTLLEPETQPVVERGARDREMSVRPAPPTAHASAPITVLVACAVCGGTHAPGSDSDPACPDQ